MALRVLVVDDEEDFLRSIVMRIELRGYEAHGVTSGDEALQYLKENPAAVDVVLLDIKMPGLGGLETLREIKSCCPSIEVIVVTGHASQEFSRRGRELGAFDYLIKPIRLEAILERIEAARRHHRGADADG
ncbi:MAG: response regulator [Thermoanaerobaculales bacterium]|jgi:DNA-binding response OmpR family regulator|nr:response regulator [Thermoanaerobaculales bacterium]